VFRTTASLVPIMESELLDECIAAAGPAWHRYEHHPWFTALESGELTMEMFVRFQSDDAPFIPFIHRVQAFALAKAPTGSAFSRAVATSLSEVFVAKELETQAEILASLGVKETRFDRWSLPSARGIRKPHAPCGIGRNGGPDRRRDPALRLLHVHGGPQIPERRRSRGRRRGVRENRLRLGAPERPLKCSSSTAR
jgi:hypothetical protein